MGRRNVKIPAAGLPRAARGRGGAPEGRGQAQEARAGGQAATRGACSALRRDGLARERGVRGAGPEAEAARRSRAATPAPRRPTPPPLRARRSVPNPLRSCGRERRRWRWSRSRAAPPPAVPRSRAPETLLPAGVAGRRGASPRPAPVPPPPRVSLRPTWPRRTGPAAGPRRESWRRVRPQHAPLPLGEPFCRPESAKGGACAGGRWSGGTAAGGSPPRPPRAVLPRGGSVLVRGRKSSNCDWRDGRPGSAFSRTTNAGGVALGSFVGAGGRETLTLLLTSLTALQKPGGR